MKKTIFTLLVWAIFTNLVEAQDGYANASLNDLVYQLNWNRTVNTTTPNIEGSPYLTEDFIDGEVYFDGKFKIENVPIRLNLYNGDMEFKEKNVVMAIADPERINKVVMGDYSFIYAKNDLVNGFVRLWNPDFPSVVTKMEIDYLKKEPAKPYVDPKPDRFERALDKHYLMLSNTEIDKIKSVKKLIEALGDHKDELTEYAKKEKISSGNVEELVKLVDYYHTLKE